MADKKNYGQFYALLRYMPGADKETLVRQFTMGRTEHLHEMKADEYKWMLTKMRQTAAVKKQEQAYAEVRRKARSSALHQMQLYGVDTTDWSLVDGFCMNPRITGKRFIELDVDELEALVRKMRQINDKKKKSNNNKKQKENGKEQH